MFFRIYCVADPGLASFQSAFNSWNVYASNTVISPTLKMCIPGNRGLKQLIQCETDLKGFKPCMSKSRCLPLRMTPGYVSCTGSSTVQA